MSNEFKHGSVGTSLSQAEWEGIGTHVVEGQLTGDLIYASSATQLRRLQISGTSTHILGISGGVPAWAAPAAAAAGSLTGSTLASGVVTTSITTVGALNAGSVTSGFGSINTGSSNITTTGTVTGGNLAGTLNTAAQGSVTSVGALNGGTITSGFGSIDNGSSTITTTGAGDFGATTVDSLSVSDGDITNVGDIALDTISADGTDITIQPSGVCFMKPSGMTSDYAFTDRSNIILALQNQTSGGTSQLEIYANDGDGTDQVGVSIWPKGTPGAITNRELCNLRYATANTRFQLETEAGGTGTARNLAIMDNGSDWMEFVAGGGVQIDKDNLYIGDTANASMTVGLTINQGANDNEIFALKSSDVAHGMTDRAETDTYTYSKKQSATGGGLVLAALTESTNGVTIQSGATTVDTTKSRSGIPAILMDCMLKDGTGVTTYAAGGDHSGANGNLWGVADQAAGLVCLVDEDGDFYSITAAQTFDAYDDALMVRALDQTKGDAIRSRWDDYVQYNEQTLVDVGILGAPVSEGGMTNVTQLQRLHNGAIWQSYTRQQEMQERIDTLETKLLALEGGS
jgi:hypothetical protein